jgi:hypothetical protein
VTFSLFIKSISCQRRDKTFTSEKEFLLCFWWIPLSMQPFLKGKQKQTADAKRQTVFYSISKQNLLKAADTKRQTVYPIYLLTKLEKL